MKIGIVNAGNIGGNLAIPWVRYGHDTKLSRERSPEEVKNHIQALGKGWGLSERESTRFSYGSIEDAARFGEVIVLSFYFPRLAHVLEELQSANIMLAGKIVIDTMNPLDVSEDFKHFEDLAYMQLTSITEDLQRTFPEACIYKAFDNLPAHLLETSKWDPGQVPPIIYVG
ncbi:hypothetical protein HJFPF1_00048 [Paramyrothecium foliicola]|nr:hypothetical protein HJFPF1_00048 [Paramyrothecium foliicola]